jgi:hypothetical protein
MFAPPHLFKGKVNCNILLSAEWILGRKDLSHTKALFKIPTCKDFSHTLISLIAQPSLLKLVPRQIIVN